MASLYDHDDDAASGSVQPDTNSSSKYITSNTHSSSNTNCIPRRNSSTNINNNKPGFCRCCNKLEKCQPPTTQSTTVLGVQMGIHNKNDGFTNNHI